MAAMSETLRIRLLVWFVALLALGMTGFWFFRGATVSSAAALAIAVIYYVVVMIASSRVATYLQGESAKRRPPAYAD